MARALTRVTTNPLCRLCAISEEDGKQKIEIFALVKWPEPCREPISELDEAEQEEDPVYDFIRNIHRLHYAGFNKVYYFDVWRNR